VWRWAGVRGERLAGRKPEPNWKAGAVLGGKVLIVNRSWWSALGRSQVRRRLAHRFLLMYGSMARPDGCSSHDICVWNEQRKPPACDS
jgi:hypothetical protein